MQTETSVWNDPDKLTNKTKNKTKNKLTTFSNNTGETSVGNEPDKLTNKNPQQYSSRKIVNTAMIDLPTFPKSRKNEIRTYSFKWRSWRVVEQHEVSGLYVAMQDTSSVALHQCAQNRSHVAGHLNPSVPVSVE